MLFKNILVPYDGSSHSKHSFKVALDMAKKYNSKISMVTVLDTSTGWWAHTNLWDNAMVGAKTLVAREFESFESVAKKAKVSFHSEIIESKSVTKAIVSYSKSKKIDLMVMGAQGITGWDKLVLGSVTDSVIHRVRCPVLIVR
ncbi:MAG: universal stress protein [Nitrosopumilus sp.]|nr:universal stress protein [Nitrososphaerota archaeon]MCH9042024.1 universal stress protein [Nitrososphaerota archaeon]